MNLTKPASSSKSSSKVATKPAKSALGAPSQLSQSSRKGKRAWRKNIDIQPVEDGLESLRAEERVVGTLLQKQTDDQLFVVDTKGDDQVRKSLPRYSILQLTSTKIISQRSAIPAVISRATRPPSIKISHAERERLLRIAKRPRRGPFNAIMDPTEFGAGSAPIEVSYAVKHSGGHDLWDKLDVRESAPDDLGNVRNRKVKKPDVPHPRDVINIPAVVAPHAGASYNPLVQAHEELLMEAYKVEKRRKDEADRLLEAQKKFGQGCPIAENQEGVPAGMVVDEVENDDEAAPSTLAVVPKMPARKTKQQRVRIAKQKAEKHALAEKALRKHLLNSVNQAKGIRTELTKLTDSRQQARLARQLANRLKLRNGLAGQRLGKHRVPENEIDVQIGEDLSENLRGLKPEGNLFRDRFISLQHRAMIEPRVLVLPTKRKAKLKVYEKHAWKRFE